MRVPEDPGGAVGVVIGFHRLNRKGFTGNDPESGAVCPAWVDFPGLNFKVRDNTYGHSFECPGEDEFVNPVFHLCIWFVGAKTIDSEPGSV
jgi:hypothetical protein